MTRILSKAERQALRKRVAWTKPAMTVELRRDDVLALLDDIERLETIEQQRTIDGGSTCRHCGRGE